MVEDDLCRWIADFVQARLGRLGLQVVVNWSDKQFGVDGDLVNGCQLMVVE